MSLVSYPVTAGQEDFADAQSSGKNYIASAVITLTDLNLATVIMYDDADASNGSTAKTTGTNGTKDIFIEPGDYILTVNSVPRNITVSSSQPIDVETAAGLLAIKTTQVGQRLINREYADANYIVQESGYSLLPGDITLTNGTKARLQIDPKGMNIKSFGLTFDSAIDDAIGRLSGVCDIIIADNFTTSGKAYTSVSDLSLVFTDNGLLTLNALADAHVLSFTTSTGIKISNPIIDGNRTAQTLISGGSAFNALHFEACGNVRIEGGDITAAAASAVRGRNTSNMKVLDVTITDSGYRQIYIAPSTTSGVDSNNVLVQGCTVKWTGLADSSISSQPAISVTNNGASLFTNVSVKNNFVSQHPDNVADSICIEGGGASNFNIEGNKCVNGDLGISWFDCDDFAVNGNVMQTGGSIGIECANRNINGAVTGNAIDGNNTLDDGIAINGGLGICDNIVISGNPITGVVNGIAMFGQSLSVRHTNITAANNNIKCVGAGKPYNIQWVDGLSISGGILDGNSLSSAIINLVECDKFTITGTTQKNIQTFCVNMSSTAVVTITESFIGANNFDLVPGNQQLNYVRNSLFAGSTVSDLVVRANNRGPEFIDYGANILSWHGTGTPQGNITAGVGSTWTQTDGGASTVSWVKETLTTSSGWVGK